jgi:hypothetical protein
MSNNLSAFFNGEELTLRQTSSSETYMLMTDEKGRKRTLRGKAAKRVLQGYCEMIRNSTNGSWGSDKELEEAKLRNKQHIKHVKSFIVKATKHDSIVVKVC